MGGAQATTSNASRRRVVVALLALSTLIGTASVAVAQTPVETARERADRFLRFVAAPTCRDNLVVVMAWQANEFTQARWNPLATTHRMKRSASFNEVGVQDYVSLTQGLRASAETLTGGATSYGYQVILGALGRCDDAVTTAEAIRASAWCRGCSNGGYVVELVPIVEQYFDRYTALHA